MREIKKNVLAILLYGSYTTGKAHIRSDIDVCVVSKTKDKQKIDQLLKQLLRVSAKNSKYDIRIFEQMPLFMKMHVVENGKITYTRNLSELNEYFYFFRKLWQDQSVNRMEKNINQ